MLRRLIPLPVKTRLRSLCQSVKYRGDAFECPLCGGRFSRMLPAGHDLPVLHDRAIVGGGRRENAACPRCGSSDRERLILLYLRRCTDIFQRPVRVLHVAPEANLQRALRAHGNIDHLSADFDSPLAMVKMDITQIDMPDAQFDVIICNHVLEHIPEDWRAMAELWRVLRPGGWAILQAPLSMNLETTLEDPTVTDPEERERLFGQRDHVRIYEARDYVRRLKESGFEVKVVDFAREIGEEPAMRFALDPREKIHIGVKRAQSPASNSSDTRTGANP